MNPQLQQQRSGQPQAGQQVPPSALPTHSVAHRCPFCGTAMRPHKSFCPNCGAQLTPVSQPPVQHPYAQARTPQAAQPTQLAMPGGGQGIPSLEIESNLHGGKRMYALTKSVINIGRDPSNDIVIDAPVVSAFHAQIVRKGNQLILVHPHPSQPHTTNGLLYQNRPILGSESFQKPLVCGDTFRIGNEHSGLITLTYNDGSGAPQGIVPAIRLNPLGSPIITSGSQSQKPGTTSVQVKAARVSAIGVVVAAIITAILGPLILMKGSRPFPSGSTETPVLSSTTSSPQPNLTTSFPLLHSSYQGTVTNQATNQTFPVSMFNVAENTSTGTFTASMTNIGCTGQVNSGRVTASGDVIFTFTAESNAACGAQTVEFKGHIDSAGGITGNWDTPMGGGNGSFHLS